MLGRLSPTSLLYGQWKVLSDYSGPGRPRPDWPARAVVFVLPLVAGTWVCLSGRAVDHLDVVLAAMALLSAGTLTGFTHMAQVRTVVEASEDRLAHSDWRRVADGVDETCTHLLAGSYGSLLCSALAVIALCVHVSTGLLASGVVATACYSLVTFLVALPRLYYAYLDYATVRPNLSGTFHGLLDR